ncbi:hypothetical protein Hanom_Chr17g01541321 [Helianthus anomalus]
MGLDSDGFSVVSVVSTSIVIASLTSASTSVIISSLSADIATGRAPFSITVSDSNCGFGFGFKSSFTLSGPFGGVVSEGGFGLVDMVKVDVTDKFCKT